MNSDFIDHWWERKYSKYSIIDHTKSIFQKFQAIKGPYENQLGNIKEGYSDDGNLKLLWWNNVANRTYEGEKLGFLRESSSFLYENWHFSNKSLEKNEVAKVKVFEKAWESAAIEHGEIVKSYPGFDKVTHWKIDSGKGSDGVNFPIRTVKISGNRPSEKGLIVYLESLNTTPEVLNKECEYTRGTRRIHIELHHTKAQTFKRKVVKDNDLSKITEITIASGFESGKEIRIRRDETISRIWEKDLDYYYEEKITKQFNRNIGKISYTKNGETYEATWNLTNSYVLGNIKTSRSGGRKCEKAWRVTGTGSAEIIDFFFGEAKWGVIKEGNSGGNYKMEWTREKPEIYNSVNKKLGLRGTFAEDPQSGVELDIESTVEDIRSEAKFIYKSLETLEIYSLYLYQPQCKEYFKPCLSITEATVPIISENIYKKLLANARSTLSLMEAQTLPDFLNTLEILKNHPNLCLDLSDLNYKLKSIGKAIKLLRQTELDLSDFQMSFEKREQFHMLKLKFSQSYFMKKKFEDLLAHLEENGEKFGNVSKEICELVEDKEYYKVCYICNTVCHENCSLDASSFRRMGNEVFKSCECMDSASRSCLVCIRKCQFNSHYHTSKRICKSEVNVNIGGNYEEISEKIREYEEELKNIAESMKKLSSPMVSISEANKILESSISAFENVTEVSEKEKLSLEIETFQHLLSLVS